MTIVYVYSKNGKIKVINHDDSFNKHLEMLNKGWTHAQTIDACIYLEYLHNNRTFYERGTDIDLLSHIEG